MSNSKKAEDEYIFCGDDELEQANVPHKFWKVVSAPPFDKESPSTRAVRAYMHQAALNGKDGVGLLLLGESLSGKTYYAVSVLIYCISRGMSALYCSVADIVSADYATMQGYRKTELLVIDNMLAEDTYLPYQRSFVTSIIKHRVDFGCPTIVCATAPSLSALTPAWGQFLASLLDVYFVEVDIPVQIIPVTKHTQHLKGKYRLC